MKKILFLLTALITLPSVAVYENVNDWWWIEESAGSMTALPAADAARIIIDAVEKDSYSVHVGSDSKMMDKMYRINPPWAAGFISKKMKGLLPD